MRLHRKIGILKTLIIVILIAVIEVLFLAKKEATTASKAVSAQDSTRIAQAAIETFKRNTVK